MTKRLFSFAMMLLAATMAWADEASIVSNTAITFDGYSSSPYQGVYLHGASAFGTDASHAKEVSGTFAGTSVAWGDITRVLTSSQGCILPTIAAGATASGSGPEGTLAFNHSGKGKLHVVYGATSKNDGMFYVMQKSTSASAYTSLYQKKLEGIAYTGVLGTRSDYQFTIAEATVELPGSGTVFLGGTQPYCVYAILFEGATTVEEETTWTFENTTASTSITLNDKLYQRATTARYWTIETPTDGGTKSFSDGKSVTVSKVARSTTSAYLGSGGIPATTTAGGGNLGDATPFFAFDAEVPGTCYALVKSNGSGEIRIYSANGSSLTGGTGKAATKSEELTEISLTATSPSSFFVGGVSNNQRDIYAIRFVPSVAYTVSVSSMTNGGVAADCAEAVSGQTVTLTVTPESSYRLETLTVTTAGGGEITTVQDATDKNQYTFTMPAEAVTVSATFSYVTQVTMTVGSGERTLSNGLIEVTIRDNGLVKKLVKGGQVVIGSTGNEQGYFDYTTSGTYKRPDATSVEVITQQSDLVELLYTIDDHWKVGYVMRSGVSGVYTYAISSGAYQLDEARYGWRVNPTILTDAWVNGRTGTMPTPALMSSPTAELQDATFQLSDGTVYTKYDWAEFVKDDQLHGITGSGIGAWLISPSTEWVNGGPMKQELTVHATETTPIILQTMHSMHFGAGAAQFGSSEQKLFGPCLFYVNDGTPTDAQTKAAEEAEAWPYEWFGNTLLEKSRSTVTGKIVLSNDFTKTTKIQVILSKAGKAPLLQGNGYQFYGETDSNGNFTIKNVRPGSYTLYAYALNGDATGTLEKTDVTVSAGATVLGDIAWNPEKKGRTLWSIGEADHTTAGFTLSDSKRQYGLWNQVPSGDKTFTVGSSDESAFYYAQVTNGETWSIKWNSDKAYDTPLYLTVALAGAAGSAKIEVKVNGNSAIQSIGTTSDNAIARSAVLAGVDALYVVEIPAGQVVKGENTIHLKTWDISGVGGVMYDIIKLESTESSFIDYGTFSFMGLGDASGVKPKWQDVSGLTDMQMIPGDSFGQRFACGPISQNNGNNCFKFRTTGSYNGLYSQYSGRTFSILGLKKGDMVTLTLLPDGSNSTNLVFEDAAQVGLSGTDVAVENGVTYIYNGDDDTNLTLKTIGAAYIQKVTIQKPAAYEAPTFTVSGNQITVTPSSPKGSETLKTYYKTSYLNVQPEIDGTWVELPSNHVIALERSAYVFIYSINEDNGGMSAVANANVELPIYDMYNFSQMASETFSSDVIAPVTFVNGEMSMEGYDAIGLNRGFGGNNLTLRRGGSNFGLFAQYAATMTIKRLSAGDWFKISHNGADIQFTSENVSTAGTTTADATNVESDVIYVVKSGSEVSLSIPKNAWIYSVQVSNSAMAPTVSYKENKDGKAVYTITSVDGNNVAYKIGTETTTPGSTTAEVAVDSKTTVTTWAIGSDGAGAESEVVLLATPIVESNGLFNFNVGSEKMPSNVSLTVESDVRTTIADGSETVSLSMPTIATAATFANWFAFQRPVSGNTMLMNNMFRVHKDEGTFHMAILNAAAHVGKVLTITHSYDAPKLYVGAKAKEYTFDEGHTVVAEDIDDNGNLLLKFDVSEYSACIQKISLQSEYTTQATLEVTEATKERKDVKIFEAKNLADGETLKYILPGQEVIRTYSNAITIRESGDLVWWVEAASGSTARQTITLRLTATPSVNTSTFTLNETESIYTLTYTKGNTVYYTVPGGTEQSATGDGSVEVTVKTPGRLIAYAKLDELVSDTLKANVFVKTPAIVESDVYEFAKIKDAVGGDYTLNTRPSGETVTVGGLTLTKPDDVVANTLDRFAFASKRIDASNGRLYETDWRLLNAGRLRSAGTVADTMAIMNVKKGAYLLMTFSGKLNYMSESTAKLAEGTDELTSEQAYEILSDGDLLIVNKSGATSDITLISVTDTEVVTAPYFTEREKLNEVTLRLGKSNFGNTVMGYYTLDGSTPREGSYKVNKNTNITVDKSCTLKAICISSTGVKSAIAEYVFKLPLAGRSQRAAYDLKDIVSKGDTLAFDATNVSVKYMENNSGWEEKSRSDFYYAKNLDRKVSVRVGSSSLAYDRTENRIQLKRAMAIHELGVEDEIVILYTGTGSLINVTSESGDEFTVNGETLAVGDEVSSGAKIRITKAKYENNCIVLNASGDVYITAIYINSEAPEVVLRPKVELTGVQKETATYLITYDKGTRLYYELSTSEDGPESGDTSGSQTITIDASAKLKAWATSGSLVSDTLVTTVYAPTPAPADAGDYDFAQSGRELPADLEVTLDPQQSVTVNGQTLYKPTAMTEQTFGGKFAFTETNTAGKIKIRTNRNLVFNRGANMNMALLNMNRGDIIAFDYTGSIKFADASTVSREADTRGTRATSTETMEPGAAYVVQKDGDVLLNLELTDVAVSISKMYVAPAPKRSKAAAIDFATAGEEEEELLLDAGAAVWYGEKEAAVVFRRMANESGDMPVYGKVSTEGGNGALRTQGFKLDRRNIAIHNLAVGDTIKVRFSQGGIVYNGYAGKGDRVSVGGKLLEAGDSIRSGDVLKVESVDYLHNYVVLLYDARAIISGIFINTPEVEKILMPTITTKTNNTFVITGGISTTGNAVTTCYTVDGSEPTIFNGTSGPYESVEVQYIRAQQMTIKAFSYSETGAQSRVVTVLYDGVDLTPIEGVQMDEPETQTGIIYDLMGRRVQNPQPGRLYIVDGKKKVYKR